MLVVVVLLRLVVHDLPAGRRPVPVVSDVSPLVVVLVGVVIVDGRRRSRLEEHPAASAAGSGRVRHPRREGHRGESKAPVVPGWGNGYKWILRPGKNAFFSTLGGVQLFFFCGEPLGF